MSAHGDFPSLPRFSDQPFARFADKKTYQGKCAASEQNCSESIDMTANASNDGLFGV